MSRFDLFFVVLDRQDERADMAIASHIVALHQHGNLAETRVRRCPRARLRLRRPLAALRPRAQPEFTTSELQRYIRYARSLKPVCEKGPARGTEPLLSVLSALRPRATSLPPLQRQPATPA
eukprot:scaffold235557_cov25-Tisochrysis_lutea.AAC.6